MIRKILVIVMLISCVGTDLARAETDSAAAKKPWRLFGLTFWAPTPANSRMVRQAHHPSNHPELGRGTHEPSNAPSRKEVKVRTSKRTSDIMPQPADAALSFEDCYALALKQSETIAIEASRIDEAQAHFLQALSIMLPNVSFNSTDTRQDKHDPSTGSSSSSSSTAYTHGSTRAFTVQQTLFNGFKAFAAVRGSRLEFTQRDQEKIRAEELLLGDVSDSFYLLVEKRRDHAALRKIKMALMDRVIELRKRERLGRSRQSEVVSAKAQLYSVESGLEAVKSQEIVARQLLEFLTGRSIGKVIDSYDLPLELLAEDYYTARAVSRPDVRAAWNAWQVAKRTVDVVNSDFLPSATLGGNYYTMRTGANKSVDWDATLTVNVPIFEGTDTLGRSLEARAKARQSELELQRVRRSAVTEIKDSYIRLTSAMAVQESLRKTYMTAKLNYRLQKKDYERSLVNNLEVLNSIQTLQNAERDHIHAIYETKRLAWSLRVAIGEPLKVK